MTGSPKSEKNKNIEDSNDDHLKWQQENPNI